MGKKIKFIAEDGSSDPSNKILKKASSVSVSTGSRINNTNMDVSSQKKILLSNEDIIKAAKETQVSGFVLLIRKSCGSFDTEEANTIKKSLIDLFPDRNIIDEIKCSRSGFIILSTSNYEVAKRLLDTDTINNLSVTVQLQRECIYSKFLIKRVDKTISIDDINMDLRAQNIWPTFIKRFSYKDLDGNFVPSGTVLIEQIGKSIPNDVKVYYNMLTVDRYVEKPRQCAKCWAFGHGSNTCRLDIIICKKCGKASHEGDCILNCKNCGLQHEADFAGCPRAVDELNISKIKSENNISRIEAIRINRSYAQATKNSGTPGPGKIPGGSRPPESDNVHLEKIAGKLSTHDPFINSLCSNDCLIDKIIVRIKDKVMPVFDDVSLTHAIQLKHVVEEVIRIAFRAVSDCMPGIRLPDFNDVFYASYNHLSPPHASELPAQLPGEGDP